MKYYSYIILFVFALLMVDCSPKVGDAVGKAGETIEKSQEAYRSSAPDAGPARKIEIGTYSYEELNNGIKLIVVENHKLPRISYQLFIDRDIPTEGEYSGLSGIAGDLLTKGTTSRTKAEIDEAVDFIGARLNSSARGGSASSLTKHTDQVLELLADVLLRPAFPEDEFNKSITQTLSGLQANKEDPGAIMSNVRSALLYGKDHPYGEITTEATVKNITLDKCKEFYNTYYKPNSAYMVVVGDITPKEAKSKIMKHFGEWEKGDIPEHKYDFPTQNQKRTVEFVDKSGAVQSNVSIGHTINMTPGHPDAIAASVMNTIMGSGFSGRLFRNLREDKGYTYGAYSQIDSDELVGTFLAGGNVRNEVTDSAIVEFLHELKVIGESEVTDNELMLAKNYLSGNFARSMESPDTVARFALNTYRYNLPKDYYQTYLEKLESVDKADVLAMAKKYINPETVHIIIVGNQDDVAEKLNVFDSEDGKVAFYDVYANKKEVDNEMSSRGVDPASIINTYINAIGGVDNLKKVNTIKQVMGMEMMGTPIDVNIYQKAPNMFSMNMFAQGMTVMKQVFNGKEGVVEQMGQKINMDAEQIKAMEEQSKFFPELDYMNDGYSLELKGSDEVDGEKCYKVVITNPDGNKSTEYYGIDSGLKLKSVSTTDGGGQQVTVTNIYSDYKEVGGVLFPHTLNTSGASPMPVEMKASSIEVNVDIDDSVFKVN